MGRNKRRPQAEERRSQLPDALLDPGYAAWRTVEATEAWLVTNGLPPLREDAKPEARWRHRNATEAWAAANGWTRPSVTAGLVTDWGSLRAAGWRSDRKDPKAILDIDRSRFAFANPDARDPRSIFNRTPDIDDIPSRWLKPMEDKQ